MGRWLDQTILHSEATRGNCMQAAVASLFGLPLSEVPNFAEAGDRKAHLALLNFAQSYGFDLTYEASAKSREGLYLACGPSERGTSHMVVYHDGKLRHDPHPSRAGLLDVEFVYIVEPLDPAIHVAALISAKRVAPLLKAASPGPWEAQGYVVDTGLGDVQSRHMLTPKGDAIFDAFNSDVACVAREYDDDGSYQYDEQGRADLAYVEALDGAARALSALLSESAPPLATNTTGGA